MNANYNIVTSILKHLGTLTLNIKKCRKMKIIVYYNKNLKMSEGKLAAQVGHVCRKSGIYSQVMDGLEIVNTSKDVIIVLGLRQSKFYEKLDELGYDESINLFIQKDLGYTEVVEGTVTAFGYIE